MSRALWEDRSFATRDVTELRVAIDVPSRAGGDQ